MNGSKWQQTGYRCAASLYPNRVLIVSRKTKDWLIGLGIAAITLILVFSLAQYNYQKQRYEGMGIPIKGDRVAVVEIFGAIYDSRRTIRQLENYGDQKSIKAIILRIDSPGGVVAPAQEIYHAVKTVRNSGKPVIASMGSLAASGGYYIACGADTIMAMPGTTTGSIGVIAEFINTRKLFDKIGVDFEVIKSGKYKDSGSPHREMTEEDRRYLQAWVDDAYDQFVQVVMDERKLSKAKVARIADGRVFTGRQALDNGLVDLLGYYSDAVDLAARMAGIEGEPAIVKERNRRTTWFDLFFEEFGNVLRGRQGAQVKYLYQ